ncbi:MAG TPA: 50S ribosomal protein L29 [Bacteroidota bacterium]|nr:50S ribosomal protein L29 [Bacteroidota bacterium]
MKAFEFRKLSDVELKKRIQEEEESLSHLKFQKVVGQLQNPMKMSQIRKDIARMKTILREREFGAAPVAAPATPEKVQ